MTEATNSTVETVRGPVDVGSLGPTLMHEHIFNGVLEQLENYGRGDWWDEEERIADAVAKLNSLKGKGIDTIVDPTVWGLGRYIPRIQRIAEQVDLNIIVATGIYTYHDLPFEYSLRGPGLLVDSEVDPMVTDFRRDIEQGIADTGVRAAFLKCAIEYHGLVPGVERIMRAVARTSVETGAPITVHTNSATRSGEDVVRVMREEGADLTKVVIGHAGDSNDLDYLKGLADAGCLLGMDRFGVDVYNPTDARVNTIVALAEQGYADRMVLSHDASCYFGWLPGEAQAGIAEVSPNWHYEHISDDVLPMLRERGVSDQQIDQMLVDNPRRYFTRTAS